MGFQNYIVLLLVALTFPFTYANGEFRTGDGSSSSSVNTEEETPHVLYVVAIYKNGRYVCTGSLITMEFVVTAIECLDRDEDTQITVQAGVNSISPRVYIMEEGPIRDAIHFIIEELTGSNDIDLGIIQVGPPFNKIPTLRTIKLCETSLQQDEQMQVIGWHKRSGTNLLSTSETIGKRGLCHRNFEGLGITSTFYGFKSTRNVDPGAPGVVGGALCAVAGSYYGASSRLYTDLSYQSAALLFVKVKTGCT